jgi:hypothetical protein
MAGAGGTHAVERRWRQSFTASEGRIALPLSSGSGSRMPSTALGRRGVFENSPQIPPAHTNLRLSLRVRPPVANMLGLLSTRVLPSANGRYRNSE